MLIIGRRDDEHVEAVVEALGARVEPLCVDAALLDGGSFALVDLDCLEVRAAGAQLRYGLTGARGWVRRLAAPGWRLGTTAGSRDAAVRASYIALVVALASHPLVDWLTPYPRLLASENKLRQAAHARRLGIRTPRTAVVSEQNQIPLDLGDVVVAKPLGPGHFVGDDGQAQVVWAAELSRDDPRLAALAGAPFLLQERVAARRHLRVVTCADQAWSCELDAEALPLDWRRDDDAHHSFRPVSAPGIESQALALASDLGLGYSSQDWIDDGAGAPAFIDLNPAGQWLFLPEPVSAQVTSAIAAHLLGP